MQRNGGKGMSSLTRVELQPMVAPEDADDLAQMLGYAAGRVREAHRVYGDELEILIAPPTAGELFDGHHHDVVWRIGTQASDWRLDSPFDGSSVTSAANEETIDATLARLVGIGVERLAPELPGLGLVLQLSDGQRLTVGGIGRHDVLEDFDLPEPPFWEVFTPDGYVIAAGPGHYWTRFPAHVPEREFVEPLSLWSYRHPRRGTRPWLRLVLALIGTTVTVLASLGLSIVTLASEQHSRRTASDIATFALAVALFSAGAFLFVSLRDLQRLRRDGLETPRAIRSGRRR